MLVSAVHQHESSMGIYMCPLPLEPPSHPPPHPTPLGCHGALDRAPCVIWQLPTGYLFYTWWCICFSATLSIHPTLSFPRCMTSLFSMPARLSFSAKSRSASPVSSLPICVHVYLLNGTSSKVSYLVLNLIKSILCITNTIKLFLRGRSILSSFPWY